MQKQSSIIFVDAPIDETSCFFASAKGIPNIEGVDDFLTEQNKITYTILTVFLMVDPYSMKQNFVDQCLNAYLKMLKLLPKDLHG